MIMAHSKYMNDKMDIMIDISKKTNIIDYLCPIAEIGISKVIIIYKYQHKEDQEKYGLSIRVSQNKSLKTNMTSIKNTLENRNYEIINHYTMITNKSNAVFVQFICNNFNEFNARSKCTRDLTFEEYNNIFYRILKLDDEYKAETYETLFRVDERFKRASRHTLYIMIT